MISSVAAYSDRYQGDIDGALSLTMTRSSRRGPWLPEEDQALLQLVRTQGANNWVRISQQIQHRSPKQCRERYHQNLKPSLKHDPISVQEGEVIERLVQEMGKRWAEIARRLGNRSDNAVKNWWNGSVNRRRRNPAQPTTGFKQVGSRLQPIPFALPSEHNYARHSDPKFESRNSAPQHEISRSGSTRPPQPSSPVNARTSSVMSDPTNASHLNTRPVNSLQTVPTCTSSLKDSKSSLSKVKTSESRPELPPLRSSSFHLPYGERMNLYSDRPPISPALSDTSQRHAPSLISDNQSMYSISPRTVTTPRPGIPAPLEIGASTWLDAQSITQSNIKAPPYSNSCQSELHLKYANSTCLDPVLQRHSFSNVHEEKLKDARMNVSTLLQ